MPRLRAFVCYSRQVKDEVATLASELQALNYEVWYDQALRGGQTWWDEILENLRGCDIFIAAISPETLDSQACGREWNYAASLGKSILPVVVGDGVSSNLLPPALSRIQLVDYRKQDRQAAFALVRALEGLPPSPPPPSPLPDSPPVPISYLSTLRERIESHDTLSFEEQSAVVVELEEGARNEADRADILALIERFTQRVDLLARIDKRASALRAGLADGAGAAFDQRQEPVTDDDKVPDPLTTADKAELPVRESSRQKLQWNVKRVTEELPHIMEGIVQHADVWVLEIDEQNTVTLQCEQVGKTNHLYASLRCRDTVLGVKQKELDKLGWQTKDRGAVTGVAGAALLYATSGLGLVALGSKKVRDYILTVEAARRWPLGDDNAELSAIASEVKVALEVIGPEARKVQACHASLAPTT